MTFLLLLAAMAAVAGFAYWVGWDNRGDVEERRRWENRPTREAADQLLDRADYRLDNAPDSVPVEESIDLDLIRDFRAEATKWRLLAETLSAADPGLTAEEFRTKYLTPHPCIAQPGSRVCVCGERDDSPIHGVPGGGEPQPTTSTDNDGPGRARQMIADVTAEHARTWKGNEPGVIRAATAAYDTTSPTDTGDPT